MKLEKEIKQFEKEGKTIYYTEITVVLENGMRIAVKPVNSKHKDALKAVAKNRGE